MAENVAVQSESLLNLDDLLQCPVCYEIPKGHIFQCNEGHHVCGRCKVRLSVCPVCRSLFFGTRNYAMEELISNFRNIRSLKIQGRPTTASLESTPAPEIENERGDDDENIIDTQHRVALRVPRASKGLFRCLCCKIGQSERLPAGRILNHLRYFHSSVLVEGQSENGEYIQAWQLPSAHGRNVIAVRVSDMGVFFLVIEITADNVYAWVSMAAAPIVSHEFIYTVTISGNDREAIFTNCVSSVRSCEGTLKKRGNCLVVTGVDARSITSPVWINAKLLLRPTPRDEFAEPAQPRAVMRVATGGSTAEIRESILHELERITRDFVIPEPGTLESGVTEIRPGVTERRPGVTEIRPGVTERRPGVTEIRPGVTEIRQRDTEPAETNETNNQDSTSNESVSQAEPVSQAAQPLSRNARRRIRQRLRNMLNTQMGVQPVPPVQLSVRNGSVEIVPSRQQEPPNPPVAQVNLPNGPSTSTVNRNTNQPRNKKKRRNRK